MTAHTATSILEAELEASELLAETLNRQRHALIQRDPEGINEITGILEEQMAHLTDVVRTRTDLLGRKETRLTAEQAELVRRIRRSEARVLRLAELNEELIADRLAYVGAMLSLIGPGNPAGYGADARAEVPVGAMSRTA